jgi:hypothetical protein
LFIQIVWLEKAGIKLKSGSDTTQELVARTDIHTLSKQMGNSVRMLEQHYGKLTATMAAERLA